MGSEVAKNPGWGGNQKPDPGGKEPFQERPLSQLWVLQSKRKRASRFRRRGDYVATSVPTPCWAPRREQR